MKIQHKRSNQLDGGAAKEPTSQFMEYGELAVNYNETDPTLFIKDSGDNVIRLPFRNTGGEVPSGETPERPDSPNVGDLYFDITIGELLVWDGENWLSVGANALVQDGSAGPPDKQL